jgi:hypothetical protein
MPSTNHSAKEDRYAHIGVLVQELQGVVREDSDSIGSAAQRAHYLPLVRQQECGTGTHYVLSSQPKENRVIRRLKVVAENNFQPLTLPTETYVDTSNSEVEKFNKCPEQKGGV